MGKAKSSGNSRSRANTAVRDFDFERSTSVRPADAIAIFIAIAASTTIIVNALFLQPAPPATEEASVADYPTPASRSLPEAGNDEAAPSAPSAPATASVRAIESSPLVKEVQVELGRRGIYQGPADGLPGPKTEAAIRSFETIAGLEQTGQANPKLLSVLRKTRAASAPPAPAPSPEVMQVQRMLDRLGMGPVTADGVFGEATRSAIRRFEASRGLTPRGEISPALVRTLKNAVALRG